MGSESENLAFNLPKDLVEPIVRESVSAAILKTLGSPAEMIQQMVSNALGEKVDSRGRVSTSSYENKYAFIESFTNTEIRNAAQAAIKAMIDQQRPLIEEAIVKELETKSSRSKIAKALLACLTNTIENQYRFNVKLDFDPIRD